MKTFLLCACFLLTTWQYLYAQSKINFANFEPDSITQKAKLYVTDKFGKEEYEKRLKISKGINVNAYPTILILNLEGKEIDRILGVNTADSLIKIITKYTTNK